jgi:hypothetical protein
MYMSNFSTTLNWLAAVSSFVAAGFWFAASFTKIPAFPDVGLDSGSWVFEPVRSALRAASRRNAVAAAFSGLAALLYAVAPFTIQ